MSPRQIKNTTIVLLIACSCMLLIAFISSCTTHANAIGIENTQKDQAHAIAEQARAMGLPETDPIIVRARELWYEADAQFCMNRDIIACVVYNEAWGGCTDRHRELVAAVVYNRVNCAYGGATTVYDVVSAPGQYLKAYATPGSYYWNRATKDPTVWAECQRIASKALNGEVVCPSNVLGQSEGTQGSGVYEICKTSYSTTYFCYG